MPAVGCSTALYCRRAQDSEGSWGEGVPWSCCARGSTGPPQRTACSANDGHPVVWELITACHVGANCWYSQGLQCRAVWGWGQPMKAWRSRDWSERPPSFHGMAPRSTAKTHLLTVLPKVLARAIWHSGRKKVFVSRLNTLPVLSVVWIFPPLQWQAQ